MRIKVIILLALLYSCNNKSLTPANENGDSKKINTQTVQKPAPQTDSLVSQIALMKADKLDCNADIYWKIIKRGKASIPFLIESLSDTTITNISHPCKQGKLNVAEVAYFAMEQIGDFPAYEVTQIQFDVFEVGGCWVFYDYLFDNKNKEAYQRMVRNFYRFAQYEYIKFDKKQLNACRRKYNIDGQYRFKE